MNNIIFLKVRDVCNELWIINFNEIKFIKECTYDDELYEIHLKACVPISESYDDESNYIITITEEAYKKLLGEMGCKDE